jgi:hypothetical protein
LFLVQPTVVGSILLAADEHLRVEELAVRASADLIDGLYHASSAPSHPFITDISTYRRVQIDEDGAWDIFAVAGLGEEGLEGARLANVGGLWVGTAICLQAMLEEVAVKPLVSV